MLMIRLARFGAKKKPFYRVVVIEKERARNGRTLEVVGHYNPLTTPAKVVSETRPHRALDQERRANVRHREAPGGRESGVQPSRLRKRADFARNCKEQNARSGMYVTFSAKSVRTPSGTMGC